MDDVKTVSLDDIVGEHTLDGVDTYVVNTNIYGNEFVDASVIRFRLDGVVYVALEDPDDGYRSSMKELIASPSSDITNVFPTIRVVARKKDADTYEVHDTLQLIDVVTGKIVMEVGTENTDDYYPSFVSRFQPENMAVNKKVGE